MNDLPANSDAAEHEAGVYRALLERQAFLLKLSDSLRWLADPAKVMAVASETTGRYLGVGRAGYGEVDANNEWFVVDHDWTAGVMTSMAGRHRVADFGPASVAAHRSDRAFIVEDVLNDPRFADHQATFKAIGLEASLLVPLVRDGRWIAGFYAQQSFPRRWTPDDENLVRDVLERTWSAVERARAEAALRASESRLRAMFNSVDQGYLEVEVTMSPDGRAVDWRYVAVNPSFERLTGMKDVTGRLVSEVAPDLEPEWAERYAQVVITGEPMRFELPAAALGRWFDVNLVNISGAGSRRIACVYDDVTDRKRADLALRESEKRQAFLLKLSDALRPLGDPLEVQSAALRVLGEHLAVNRVFFNDVDEERDEYVINRTYTNGLPPLTGKFRLSEIPRTAELAGSGQTVVFDDASADPRLSKSERASYAAMGVTAGIGVPLIKDESWVAGLGVHCATPKVVGPFATVEDARDALDANGADLAIIDINLGSGPAFDLARHLDMVGLPFLIATGYDRKSIPDDLKRVMRLEKPYSPDELISAAVGVYEATKAGGR